MAVAGRDRPIGCARGFDGELRSLQFVDEQVEHAVHQGHIHLLPKARAGALQERCLDATEGVHGTQQVGHKGGCGRGVFTVAGVLGQQPFKATGGLHDHGVGRLVGQWPALPVARDGAVNELRIDRAQNRCAQPQPLHHARPKVFQHHVGLQYQALDDGHAFRCFQVQHQALFARVQLAKVGAEAITQRLALAHVVTFRRLDLDDLGAQVGHQSGAIRPGNHEAEVEHTNAAQGTGQSSC